MTKFKVGDKVVFNKKRILEINGELSHWYTNEEFEIIKIEDDFDISGNNIVQLNKSFDFNNKNFANYITSQFLQISVKKQRKDKLNKIKKVITEERL